MRNLRPCLKVAADFVSPEAMGQCAAMSEQLRNCFHDAVRTRAVGSCGQLVFGGGAGPVR